MGSWDQTPVGHMQSKCLPHCTVALAFKLGFLLPWSNVGGGPMDSWDDCVGPDPTSEALTAWGPGPVILGPITG